MKYTILSLLKLLKECESVNKYEVRMKATFYFEEQTVKSLTLIDTVLGEDMVEATKNACRIQAALTNELCNEEKGYTYGYEELVNFADVDEVSVEISAIVPYSG